MEVKFQKSREEIEKILFSKGFEEQFAPLGEKIYRKGNFVVRINTHVESHQVGRKFLPGKTNGHLQRGSHPNVINVIDKHGFPKIWMNHVCDNHQLMASACGCLDQSRICKTCETEFVHYLGGLECLCTLG